MRRWGRRAGVAAATGAVVAALALGAPAMAFADDAVVPPAEPTTTTQPAPATPTPTTTTPPEGETPTPAPDAPPITEPTTTSPAGDPTPPAAIDPAVPAEVPAALLTPVLTATPATGLVNHQSVAVTGSGWTPNAGIGWAECKNGGGGQADCDINNVGSGIADGSGAFSASFTVHRILHTANGDFDCASAAQACTIGAGKIVDQNERAGAPLTFDPSVPLPPPPTLLADPTTGLIEGQSIALSGGGFVPNGQVYVVECTLPASISSCQTLTNFAADGSGSFTATAAVHRTLAMPPFGSTDCATTAGTCILRAVSINDYDFAADVALDFDPSGPAPTAQVTIDPDTDLLNFQSVTVSGSGFAPPTGPGPGGVQLLECTSGATSYADCVSTSGFALLTPAGAFSTPFSVRRILHLGSGDFDCADAPGACSIVASSFSGQAQVVATPISFDASVPPPPPPTISVTPDTGLVQGQQVSVTGGNFAPNSFVAIGECLTGSQPQGYCGFGGSGVPTDANGAFTTTFSVRRGVLDFASYPPGVVDCASAAQKCSVTAFSYDGGDQAATPVDFDPSVPINEPDVTVSPQFDLPDRALVHVHSSGLVPGDRVIVSQCDSDAPAVTGSCSSGFPNLLIADANGEVDTTVRVHRTFSYFDGVVIIADTANCADAVGACVIRVQSVDDPLAVTDVPLGFDPTAVAPGPVISTTPAGPYTDGEEVVVHGSGFTPDATLGLAQCQSDVEPDGHTCDSKLFEQFTADGNGEFTRTMTMHTQVDSFDATVDCSATGPGCVLFAANRNDYGAERAVMPITFGSAGGPGVEVAGVQTTRALAFTGAGSRTLPLALTGFSLVLIGGVLVLLSRRRRVGA